MKLLARARTGIFNQEQHNHVQSGNRVKEAKIIDDNVLDGIVIRRFVRIPCGLVALRDGTLPLISFGHSMIGAGETAITSILMKMNS